jgi:flavin reductase (DIM6/NTAB) family NADH-FMN oxidoreductase RutF
LPNSRSFRDVLGRYPTGVALVTAFSDGRALGITVNSFASVSLDPPLILWSIERDTERHGIFRDAEHFAINILASDQADLAHACALEADLAKCRHSWTGETAPLIDGAVGHLVCRLHSVMPGGDHDIILGEVAEFATVRDVPALVFYRGGYSQPG